MLLLTNIGFLQLRKMMVVLVSDFNDVFVSFQLDFKYILPEGFTNVHE